VKLHERQTFALVPRRRPAGLVLGDLPSRRRGHGTDVVGTRAYEIGDPVSTIDWFASARLSAATGSDQFIVRERSTDEAPRVALVCDRRPAMAIYEPPLPWLSKQRALAEVTAAIVVSSLAARAAVGSLDYGDGEPYWLTPGRRDVPWMVAERQVSGPFDAPDDNVDQALQFLGRARRNLPRGSFVFVLSDFLVPPSIETLLETDRHGWEAVPVVIQDPTWEQSFPAIGGVAVPVADPRDGTVRPVRLSAREAVARREENETRLKRLFEDFISLGLDPILIGTSDPREVDHAFGEWAELRRRSRWVR
jgi:uncharacterized protein (DUF58 family)